MIGSWIRGLKAWHKRENDRVASMFAERDRVQRVRRERKAGLFNEGARFNLVSGAAGREMFWLCCHCNETAGSWTADPFTGFTGALIYGAPPTSRSDIVELLKFVAEEYVLGAEIVIIGWTKM